MKDWDFLGYNVVHDNVISQICVAYVGINRPKSAYKSLQELKKGVDGLIKNFKNIDDKDFIKTIATWYEPNRDYDFEQEVLDIRIGNRTIVNLKSDDIDSERKQEGWGKDFSWWTVWHKFAYKAYVNSNKEFEDRVYTKREIAKLANSGEIEIIGKYVYKTIDQSLEKVNSSELDEQCKISSGISLLAKLLRDKYDFGFVTGEFYDIPEMSEEECSRFCRENKDIVKLVKGKFSYAKLKKDFSEFTEWYKSAEKEILDLVKHIKEYGEKVKKTGISDYYNRSSKELDEDISGANDFLSKYGPAKAESERLDRIGIKVDEDDLPPAEFE